MSIKKLIVPLVVIALTMAGCELLQSTGEGMQSGGEAIQGFTDTTIGGALDRMSGGILSTIAFGLYSVGSTLKAIGLRGQRNDAETAITEMRSNGGAVESRAAQKAVERLVERAALAQAKKAAIKI